MKFVVFVLALTVSAVAPHAGGRGHGGPKDVTPDLDKWVKQLASIPIRIVHGAKDDVVPSERSERIYQALLAAGAREVDLVMLPDKSHNIGDTFSKLELYVWLLKHSRGVEKMSKP